MTLSCLSFIPEAPSPRTINKWSFQSMNFLRTHPVHSNISNLKWPSSCGLRGSYFCSGLVWVLYHYPLKLVCLCSLLGVTLHVVCKISKEVEGAPHSWQFSCLNMCLWALWGLWLSFRQLFLCTTPVFPACHSARMMNRLSNSYLLKRKSSGISVAMDSFIKEKHWEMTLSVYHFSIHSAWMALLLNHLIMLSCKLHLQIIYARLFFSLKE